MTRDDSTLGIGIVGAGGGRSKGFQIGLQEHDSAAIHAVCDVDQSTLKDARESFGAEVAYTDYEEMVDDPVVDAVVVATPQHLHAPQATKALQRDVHVLSEVPAADSMEQARKLVEAATDSNAAYMMGENTTYFKENVLVKAMVEAGFFGDLYYAEGNYLHETRELMRTTWRQTYRIGVNGITYPTHQLGPVLQWFSDDRIARVTCAGSGRHYQEELGEYDLEDTTTLLGKTEQDRLVKVRMDMLSNRPNPKRLNQYQLQGTEGYYESPIDHDEKDKIWLQEFHETEDPHERRVHDLTEFEEEYLPERYLDPPINVAEIGHGGSDYYQVVDFLDSVVEGAEPPIDVHKAMDMTIPGLVSRDAIDGEESWVEVPDTREW